jgi:acyl-CoA synthetase (AMP-forming)/AMP-acid ligase II
MAEVAVGGVPDARWGESVKAVVAVRERYQVTIEDIDAVCLSHIASYKRPRSVDFVNQLPKTGSGKIKRQEIRRPLGVRRFDASGVEPIAVNTLGYQN